MKYYEQIKTTESERQRETCRKALPVDFDDNLGQDVDVFVHKSLAGPLLCVEGVVHEDVGLKVKNVFVLFFWIPTVTIQPGTKTEEWLRERSTCVIHCSRID